MEEQEGRDDGPARTVKIHHPDRRVRNFDSVDDLQERKSQREGTYDERTRERRPTTRVFASNTSKLPALVPTKSLRPSGLNCAVTKLLFRGAGRVSSEARCFPLFCDAVLPSRSNPLLSPPSASTSWSNISYLPRVALRRSTRNVWDVARVTTRSRLERWAQRVSSKVETRRAQWSR